ncbi:glycosyltransferase [Lysobacter cavernae]|uniref:Glycosyltransferase n=1 Tax=Lysobacter cavernae TaxID=1685901 RepID=A0ABV7RRV3_9GAMM
MAMSWADLRFLYDRGTGLFRRGLTSLHTRGLRASWQRVLKQFHRVPAAQRLALYLPEPAPFAPFSVPYNDAPVASIVIPVYNQFAHTLTCLRALAAHPPQATIEIIVVDDGSSDETEAALRQIDGLHYHRRAQNGGFIAACNDGAALARGGYVVFLNNDTVPQPGWLDALLATFDEHPNTGLVGAQLIYPDGRLQEAGGLVWQDGSADKIGRLRSTTEPEFDYVRRVHYCSGAAITIPRHLFESIGGFDTRYAPAFYEDTELGMRVRAAGLHALCQPLAKVVHVEGVTTGTDTRRGIKAYQVRNQQTFRERWATTLAAHPGHGSPSHGLTDHLHGHTVLIIDALTPQPDRDSGSLRLINLMRLLREENAHVVFLPTDRAHSGTYTRALQQIGVEAWSAPGANSPPAWLRDHGARFDTIVVCRHYVMREWLPLLRKYAPQAKVVFDTVDLHYLRERRGAELARDPALARAAERTRALELEIIAKADATLVVSEVERTLLAQDAPQAQVDILSNLHRIQGHGLPFERRRDLVFVGGFRHPPNVDAVRWFVGEAFPLIRAQLPDVRFHCIGSDTPAEIAALAAQPGVEIHGHVPDLAPYMDGARIALAPLRYGAGVKGKINLSMAHGQPVVATSCAVEGMHLRDGEDVLVADEAAGFAEAVVRLYRDPTLWQRLADNGLRNVERHFSLDAGRDVVRRVLLDRN